MNTKLNEEFLKAVEELTEEDVEKALGVKADRKVGRKLSDKELAGAVRLLNEKYGRKIQ